MSLIKCPECQTAISSKAPACPSCGMREPALQIEELIITTYKYRMTSAAPLWFMIFCGLVLFYGTGLLLLLIWFIMKTPAPTLTITSQAIVYKTHGEKRIELTRIDRVEARSSLPQSLINTGYLVIYTDSWLGIPLIVNGLPDPSNVKKQIISQKNDLP